MGMTQLESVLSRLQFYIRIIHTIQNTSLNDFNSDRISTKDAERPGSLKSSLHKLEKLSQIYV